MQEDSSLSTAISSEMFLYDAFASYATDPDRDLIRDVESFLESLHRNNLVEPAYRRKLELCVDGSDFKLPGKSKAQYSQVVDDPVFDLVVEYMKRSRRFVLFIGPRSRDHLWIMRELDWWLDHRDPADVLIAVTHGHDPTAERVGTFPLRIRELNLDRSLWIDLRSWRNREPGGRALRPYEEERLRLAASLMNPPAAPGELIASWRVGVKQRQRQRIIAGGVASIFAFAALTGLGLATNAWLDSARLARASGLALFARQTGESSQTRSLNALVYAASSLALEPTSQGYVALSRSARVLPPHLWTVPHSEGSKVDVVEFIEGDRIVASAGSDANLRLGRAADGLEIGRLALGGRATAIVQHPTRPLLAIATLRGFDLVAWSPGSEAPNPHIVRHVDFDRVRGLAFLPDGRRLLVGAFDGTLAEFLVDEASLEGWRPHREMKLHDSSGAKVGINGVGIDAISNRLIVPEISGTIYCMDVADWSKRPREVKYTSNIFAMAQHPTLQRFAMSDSDGGWLIFDSADCKILSRMAPPQDTETIARDAAGALRVASRFERPRTGIVYDPGGELLGIASNDGTVRIVTAQGGSLVKLMIHPTMSRAVAFARDRRRVVTGSDDGHVHLWDIGTDLERWRLAGIDSIAVDPKGVWIAVWGDDHVLRLLSTTNGSIYDFARLPNDPSSVELAASGDGRHLVVRVDGAARVESMEITESGTGLRFGSHFAIETPAAVSPIAGGPDAKRILGEAGVLAIGTADGDATLFGKDGVKRASLHAPAKITALALTTSEQELLVGYGNNDTSGACFCSAYERSEQNWKRLFASFLTWISSDDSVQQACRVEMGPLHCVSIKTASSPDRASISPAGDAVAISIPRGTDDGTLLIARRDKNFTPITLSSAGQVRDLAFSPDGHWLAVGGTDRAVTIYDTVRAAPIAELPFANPVRRVSWLPERQDRLVTLDGFDPGFLRLWAWKPEALVADACTRWPDWYAVVEEPALPHPVRRSDLCK